jgi:hypothetical protein
MACAVVPSPTHSGAKELETALESLRCGALGNTGFPGTTFWKNPKMSIISAVVVSLLPSLTL